LAALGFAAMLALNCGLMWGGGTWSALKRGRIECRVKEKLKEKNEDK